MDHQIASNNDQAEEENGRESIFLTPEVVSNHNNDTESAQHVREHLQPSPVRDDDVSRQSLESNGNFSVSKTVEEIVEDSNSMSVPPSTYSESNDIPDNESENGKANKDVNDEEEEDDEDDDEDEDEEEDEEEESLILDSRLRRRKSPDRRGAAKELNERRGLVRNISRILKKDDINEAEETLLAQHPELVKETKKRHHRQKKLDERKLEVEDSPEVLTKKCLQLAKAIQKSKNLVVYTGAGISTAANIPDYRGPNGVWTLLDQGKKVAQCNLEQSSPTFTHMALFSLFKRGKLKHIVSQNCDGLHIRSGMPRYSLSEIHGNMFIEICKQCKPMRPFARLFDVTERTNKNRHMTQRRCYVCGSSLYDTIVHFGERGSLKWPINWSGATKAAERADVILCMGSSLKVLRKYTWLWCMDRPPRHRPKLYVVNLQWTPKDGAAKVKINGRCDDVMRQVMSFLDIHTPEYCPENDPLLSFATPLHELELHTTTRRDIVQRVKKEEPGDLEASEDSLDSTINCDHDYASRKRPKRAAAIMAAEKAGGRFVDAAGLDLKRMKWPRDALYLPYEPNFEYIEENQVIGEDAFCCNCCDPAMKPRRNDDSDEDESDEEADDMDTEDQADDSDSKTSSQGSLKNGLKLELKEEKPDISDNDSPKSNTPTLTSQPGWFGKGRPKSKRSRMF